MREIKFRAWSPSKKIWRSDWSISSYREVLDLNEERIDDDLILCQYTGLKDKNGKEIYEGDIIIVYEYLNGELWEGHIHNAEVVFEKGCFTMTPCWRGQHLSQEVEIIGNIYENPEKVNVGV